MNSFIKTALLLVLLGFISCVDDVVFDKTGEKVVVVNCVLKYPAQRQTVKVMYSSAVGTTSSGSSISDAEVSISDLTDTSKDRTVFQYGNNNEYSASLSVIPGHKYSLEVKIGDKEMIVGETTVPEGKTIIARYTSVAPLIANWMMEAIEYDVEELFGHPFWIYAMNFDETINDWKLVGKIGAMDGYTRKFSITSLDGFNVTGEGLKFPSVEWGDAPHDVQDGFMAFHKYYLRFTGEKENWWAKSVVDNHTIFVDGSFTGAYYNLSDNGEAVITPNKEMPEDNLGVVVLSVPSEEYDSFLKELFMFKEKEEDMEDITLLYEMTNMHSNLTGAMGVFGAQVVYYLPWVKPGF
ncbi:MAG: DUF4249 family protein [Bacteroidales bacterium]|nr:DUF4249 family protein [Bacteroidales bacterium]